MQTDQWGNNPASIEAVATALAVLAVILALLSLRESKAQRRALEADVSARMRPWVGLFGFGFERSAKGEPSLRVLLRNFGAIPAGQARLKLTVKPQEAYPDEQSYPIEWEEPGEKSLMPDEEGNYTISLGRHPQMEEWIRARRDVEVTGTFRYALNERKFESQFEATLWFSRNHATDVEVSSKWRNTSAV